MRLFLLISFLISGSLQAREKSCSELEQNLFPKFKSEFSKDVPGYSHWQGWCSLNIYKMLERFSQQGMDLSRAEVLYLFKRTPENTTGTIYPVFSRDWTGDGWEFHVVLNYRGLILDLDYTKKATLIKTADYFEQMFLSDPRNDGMLAKVISAEEFLRVYAVKYAEYPQIMIRTITDKDYPPIPVRMYVNIADEVSCR